MPSFVPGLLKPSRRSIGGIVAQVTVRESEQDTLVITQHPLEQGAPISDHAYKEPSRVTISAGWSQQIAGNLSANGGVYAQLLQWQAALQPFDLYTGKRAYKDMLIQSLSVTTDEQSEFALMAEIVCQQVILVSVSTRQASSYSDNSGDHANEAATGPAKDNGEQQPKLIGETPEPTNAEPSPMGPPDTAGPPAPPQKQEYQPPFTPAADAAAAQAAKDGAAPPSKPPINIPDDVVVVPIPPPIPPLPPTP